MFDESFMDELANKVADRLASRAMLLPDTQTEPDPNLEATLAAEVAIAEIHADADVAIAEAYAEAETEVAESNADSDEAVAEIFADTIEDTAPEPEPEPVIVNVEDDSIIDDLSDALVPDFDETPDVAPMPDVAPKASHWFQRSLR